SQNPEQMWKTREKILLCERILLDTMSFNITVEHSHLHAAKFVLQISGGNREDARGLQQTTSNILNDSLSTNMCLNYSPALIAAAAVLLAARFLKAKTQVAKPAYQALEAMESKGEVFGFKLDELMKVEDELISTYDEEARSSRFGSV